MVLALCEEWVLEALQALRSAAKSANQILGALACFFVAAAIAIDRLLLTPAAPTSAPVVQNAGPSGAGPARVGVKVWIIMERLAVVHHRALFGVRAFPNRERA